MPPVGGLVNVEVFIGGEFVGSGCAQSCMLSDGGLVFEVCSSGPLWLDLA